MDLSLVTAVVDPTETVGNDADLLLSSVDSEEALAATLELWRPTPEIANFRQVAEVFGVIAVCKVARGFLNELAAAIAGLSRCDFAPAHRIAGLAGTLGFGRVSQAWLAIDEGDLSDIAGARREARLAQVAVARWLDANRPDPEAVAQE
jgi:hypothetical protein